MKQQRVIALGFFDGVHLGHGALLRQARLRADALGIPAAALTFDAHPDTVVFGQPVALINTLADRRRLMTEVYAMDHVILAHFDRDMAAMPWEDFVEDYLVRRLGAAHVVCGHDFSFGHRGQGTPDRLREKCAALGVGCDVIEQVSCHGAVISSTRIRTLLQQGNLDEANCLLGHRHFLTGTVCPGKQLGRQMGIPTANVPLPEGVVAPAFGVYATQVQLSDGSRHMAVTNVGVCPTVQSSTQVTVEPWLLDFSGDLYGRKVRIEFCSYLRPERKFPSLDDLQAEIRRNAQQTRNWFAGNGPKSI